MSCTQALAYCTCMLRQRNIQCRESRYFKSWKRPREVEEHGLPPEIRAVTGQRTCPLGDAALQLRDAVLAAETCEELFTPRAHARAA